MQTTTAALRLTRRFDATPERVFDAWVDPAVAGRWLFATAMRPLAHVEIDARVGGRFVLVERDGRRDTRRSGTYLRLVQPSHLAFTMTTDDRADAETSVAVGLRAARRGCVLTLAHADVARGDLRALEARWLGVLYGLAETLDLMRHRAGHGALAGAAPAMAG